MSEEQKKEAWAKALTAVSLIGFVVILVVLLVTGEWATKSPLVLWGLIALAITLLLIGLGIGATGKWYGVIVEKNRNRASLSRLQISLWTIMVVSAFLSMAFVRTLRSTAEPAPEDIAACKADYVANTYGVNIADLEGGSDTIPEAASEAMTKSQEALGQATDELALGMTALEEAIAETHAGDPEEVLDELGALQDAVSGAQENLDLADEALIESETELDAPQEGASPSEEITTLEQALAEAEEECIPQPLKIVFPQELLLVLGISTASFAGSSLIKSNKQNKPSVELKRLQDTAQTAEKELEEKSKQHTEAQKRELATEAVLASERANLDEIPETPEGGEPSEEREEAEERVRIAEIAHETAKMVTTNANAEKDAAEQALSEAQKNLEARKDQGLLCVADEPRFTDIFYGDQEGDCQFIDLGKVQMFFFTASILVAYGVAVGDLLQNVALVMDPLGVDFPLFSSSMTTLLGISHAGYLTVKTPDRQKTA